VEDIAEVVLEFQNGLFSAGNRNQTGPGPPSTKPFDPFNNTAASRGAFRTASKSVGIDPDLCIHGLSWGLITIVVTTVRLFVTLLNLLSQQCPRPSLAQMSHSPES
jgi:hypothetical protein